MASFSQEPVIVPRSKQVRRPHGSAPAISIPKAEPSVTPQVEQQRVESLRSVRGPTKRPTISTPKQTVSRENLRVLQQQLSQRTPSAATDTNDQVTMVQEQTRARLLREQQLQTRVEQAKYRQAAMVSAQPPAKKQQYKIRYLVPLGVSIFKDLLDFANADMVVKTITTEADVGFFTSLALNTFDGLAFSGLMFVLTLLISIPLVFWFVSVAKRAKIEKRDTLMWGLIMGYFAEMVLFGVNLLPGMVLTTLLGVGYIKLQQRLNPSKPKKDTYSSALVARQAVKQGGKLVRKFLLRA